MNTLRKLLTKNWIELLISIYILLGGLTGIELLTHTHYYLGLMVQLLALIKLLANGRVNKKCIERYIVTISVIFLISISFLYIKAEPVSIINRILPLICIFGINICFASELHCDYEKILYYLSLMICCTSIIMLLDVLNQKIFGNGWWKPILYLGKRYGGPFYDPNYAAIYFGIGLILVWKNKKYALIPKFLMIVVLTMCLILCGSLTSIILLPFCIILNSFTRNNKKDNILFWQIIVVITYVIGLFIWNKYRSWFYDVGVKILSKIYSEGADIKYMSLEFRFSTQYKALEIATQSLIGKGPRQIINYLGRDTHNSYISLFFEQGFLGLILIINSLRGHAKKLPDVSRLLFFFIVTNAFFLNIHYTTAYTVLLIAIQISRFKNTTTKIICRN